MSLIDSLGTETLVERQHVAELDILTMGITFTVYSDGQDIDRAWPFDIIPRVIDGDAEWDRIEAGLAQRLRALNMFIDDLYNDQRVIADGVFPAELLTASVNFRRAVPRRATRSSACGPTSPAATSCATPTATMYVLEDNLRVPVGVSYVLENRRDRQASLRRAVRQAAASARRRLHRRAEPAADLARARGRRPTATSSC